VPRTTDSDASRTDPVRPDSVVLVVDDDPDTPTLCASLAVRRGIASALCSPLTSLSVPMCRAHGVDVTLLGVGRHNVARVLDAVRRLRRDTDCAVVCMARRPDSGLAAAAAKAGAVGLVDRPAANDTRGGDVLATAVVTAASGRAVLSDALADAALAALRNAPDAVDAASTWPLTPREVQVMQLVAMGHRNDTIASELACAPKTVRNHLNHVYAKLGVHHRAAALSVWLGVASA
jgi:DNA-binding NarL/FixJ family response regulator